MQINFWWKELKNRGFIFVDKELSEQKDDKTINPEYEEKEIVEAMYKISEYYHGGDEITFSNNSQNQGSQNQSSESGQLNKDNSGNQGGNYSINNGNHGKNGSYMGGGKGTTHKNNNKVVELQRDVVIGTLKTVFQLFIEKIGELETKEEIPNGSERISIKQLLKRNIKKRTLKSCYVDRYKDRVILIVDTSGSMDWWSDILSKITTIAKKRGDIEIYEAPNGEIIINGEYIERNELINKIKNRIIIYIGDFDGGDTPYELGKHNRVYWICNEDRYWDTIDHNWCSHSLSEYPKTVKILWAYNEQDLIRVFSGKRTKQIVNNYD